MTLDELAKQLAAEVSDGIKPEVERLSDVFDTYRATYPLHSLERNWKTYQTRLAKLGYEMLELSHDLLMEDTFIEFEVK